MILRNASGINLTIGQVVIRNHSRRYYKNIYTHIHQYTLLTLDKE